MRIGLLLFFAFFLKEATCQDVFTKVKRSAVKATFAADGYSRWYLLESDPAPEGYMVSDAQLQLTGPVSCGTTAQCIEGERTPKHSVWIFRIQTQAGKAPLPVDAALTTKYRKLGSDLTYILIKNTPERFSSRGPFLGCVPGSDERVAPLKEGPWCSLSADRPKPGYRIKSASFSLNGDRMCFGNDFDREEGDGSAECRLTKRTDEEVTWEFRMLGHPEGGKASAGKSFGELRTVYEKIP